MGAITCAAGRAGALAGLGLAMLLGAPAAGADPELPPPDPALPAPPAPPPDPEAPFAAASQETKQQPFTALADLLSAAGQDPALGQLPGAAAPPAFDPLNSAHTLLPQYYRMPTPDMTSPYLLTQDAPAGPFARVDAFKGAHALAHGALGRMPAAQLGQPLPGTAPPPGTNIPAGPEQFLPDPPLPVPPLPVPPLPPPPTG